MTLLSHPAADKCIIKCDRCGDVVDLENSDFYIRLGLWGEVFRGVSNFKRLFFPPFDYNKDLCKQCAIYLTPVVYRMRDVAELLMEVNKLERAISEKRKQGTQDNRATAPNAGKRCEGRYEWRPGHRTSHGTAQAGKEHQRKPIQRNENCHV